MIHIIDTENGTATKQHTENGKLLLITLILGSLEPLLVSCTSLRIALDKEWDIQQRKPRHSS
jgi:hypothetical protein